MNEKQDHTEEETPEEENRRWEAGEYAHLKKQRDQWHELAGRLARTSDVYERDPTACHADLAALAVLNPVFMVDLLAGLKESVKELSKRVAGLERSHAVTALAAVRPLPLQVERRVVAPPPANQRPVPPGTRFRVLARDGFACVYCGATGKTHQLVVDHVVPRARGGSNEVDNLRTACVECNSGKSDGEVDLAPCHAAVDEVG